MACNIDEAFGSLMIAAAAHQKECGHHFSCYQTESRAECPMEQTEWKGLLQLSPGRRTFSLSQAWKAASLLQHLVRLVDFLYGSRSQRWQPGAFTVALPERHKTGREVFARRVLNADYRDALGMPIDTSRFG